MITSAPLSTMGQLYAVTDNHLTVHAGRVGRGILCNLVPKDPTQHTGRRPVSWHYDMAAVDCPRCIGAIRDLMASSSNVRDQLADDVAVTVPA